MFTPVIRRRDRRPPLLLAVALAVAVPGCLVTSCGGQAGSGQAGGDAAAAGRAAAVGKAAVTAGRPGTIRAVRLLAQAARAAITTSYQGEEVVTRWSGGGESVLVSQIWHVSGGQTVTRTLATGDSLSSRPYLSSDSDGQAPEGVLGVTVPLVQLLEAHYLVAYAGVGSADNRPAQVVEAWRADGSLAARFWLDDATKLPLERQVFDSAAHVIGQDVFINVGFGNPGPEPMPPADPGATAGARGPWAHLLTRAQLLAQGSRGWLVPAGLPGGLALFTGAEASAGTGPVLDLGYSDGLSVISVFEQHGNLAAELAGWRRTTVDGRPVFVAEPDQRSLTWSSQGMVYTVLADAPVQTVDAAVGVLPHDGPAGFWKRMSRGLARLASLANPFR